MPTISDDIFNPYDPCVLGIRINDYVVTSRSWAEKLGLPKTINLVYEVRAVYGPSQACNIMHRKSGAHHGAIILCEPNKLFCVDGFKKLELPSCPHVASPNCICLADWCNENGFRIAADYYAVRRRARRHRGGRTSPGPIGEYPPGIAHGDEISDSGDVDCNCTACRRALDDDSTRY